MYPFPANYFKADGVTGGNPDSIKMQMVFYLNRFYTICCFISLLARKTVKRLYGAALAPGAVQFAYIGMGGFDPQYLCLYERPGPCASEDNT